MNRVDAAVEWTGGKIYLFGGDQYVRLDPATGCADADYPKRIADSWPGVFEADIDAAVLWNDGKAYFFKGDQYIRYDVEADQADEGFPRRIADSWPGVFARDIDGAVLWNNGKAYFFKGDQYVRYDVAADKADDGFPRKIVDSWPGAFPDDIDDVVNWGDGKAVFLKGVRYIVYDIAADSGDAPKMIPPAWFAASSAPAPSGGTTGTSTPTPTGTPALSARRRHVIDDLLPGVLPSAYGQQKFIKLTFGLTKDNPNVTPGYTTCGSLPMYIARMLKDQVITGTNGVRTAGVKKNAWVVADGVKRPQPGDLYALLNQGETDRVNGGVAHVGVILDATGNHWKTADAGQGDGWAADYVTREYDAQAGTLTGEVVKATGARPPRVLAGWIDLDKYPFPPQ